MWHTKDRRTNWWTHRSDLYHYFSGHVCLSIVRGYVGTYVTKNFFRLNRLGITPWLLGSTPGLAPGSPGPRSPSGGARIYPRSRHFLVIFKCPSWKLQKWFCQNLPTFLHFIMLSLFTVNQIFSHLRMRKSKGYFLHCLLQEVNWFDILWCDIVDYL